MQLLVLEAKNHTSTTALCILCIKYTLMILLLLHLVNGNSISAERICHQCRGINCLRTTYKATQKCFNDLDICVTVFDGQTVVAQGCLEQLEETLRYKCVGDPETERSNGLRECVRCKHNLCNNIASSSFECIKCDSAIDANCSSNPNSLNPSKCEISRTPNEYCFVKRSGQRVIRGCANNLEEQILCLLSDDCMACQPSVMSGCNDNLLTIDDSGLIGGNSGEGESGSVSEGGNTGDNGSGNTSNGGSTGEGESGGGSDEGNTGTNESGNGGAGSDNGSSGTGDSSAGSNSNGTNIVNFHFYMLIINVIINILTST